jgi:hypothetical protein
MKKNEGWLWDTLTVKYVDPDKGPIKKDHEELGLYPPFFEVLPPNGYTEKNSSLKNDLSIKMLEEVLRKVGFQEKRRPLLHRLWSDFASRPCVVLIAPKTPEWKSRAANLLLDAKPS